MLFILGWTPRGSTMASAMAFLGPRPDSSMLWRGSSLHYPPLGQYLHRGEVIVNIVQLEWGSSSSSNTCPFWAEPNNRHIYTDKTLRLGMGGAQVAAILVQAEPGTGGPKCWPTATSWRQVRRLIWLAKSFFTKFIPAQWRQDEFS